MKTLKKVIKVKLISKEYFHSEFYVSLSMKSEITYLNKQRVLRKTKKHSGIPNKDTYPKKKSSAEIKVLFKRLIFLGSRIFKLRGKNNVLCAKQESTFNIFFC